MEIGQAIKQKKFRSEAQKFLINIIYTGNFLKNRHAAVLKPYGITPEQYNVLRILRGQYPTPVTVNLIIERMLDQSSNASRLVEKLRVKKLVSRAVCPDDRRAVNVVISETGLRLLEKLDTEENDLVKSLIHLTNKEAKQLNELLDKVRS